jgi:HAD domain in Swiss Army Knife RNA repair proteins
MKVLFLDIDGVLNSEETFRKRPEAYFPYDPYMVMLLHRIIEATGCQVVLSSSWRHHEPSKEFIRKTVCEFLSITPTLNTIRGEEIKAWLESDTATLPPIERYAILDDDDDFLPDQPLFQTSWKIGLTEEITKNVIAHLNKI